MGLRRRYRLSKEGEELMDEINYVCLECIRKIENKKKFDINRNWDGKPEFARMDDVLKKYGDTEDTRQMKKKIEEACNIFEKKTKDGEKC